MAVSDVDSNRHVKGFLNNTAKQSIEFTQRSIYGYLRMDLRAYNQALM